MCRCCFPLFNFASSPRFHDFFLFFLSFSFRFQTLFLNSKRTNDKNAWPICTSDPALSHCHIFQLQPRIVNCEYLNSCLFYSNFKLGTRTSFIVSICFVLFRFVFCSIQVTLVGGHILLTLSVSALIYSFFNSNNHRVVLFRVPNSG